MPATKPLYVSFLLREMSNSTDGIEGELSQSDLIKKAARSLKWSSAGQVVPRLISPIANLVLAAILVPDDFGLIAVSTLVVSLAQNLVGLGAGQALIQKRDNMPEAASTAFWMNLFVGMVAYAFLWIIAPWISTLYRISQLQGVLRISGLSLILFSVSAVPSALLQRDLEFKKLLFVASLPQVASAALSICLASMGNGVWALVWGQLAGSAVGALSVWASSRWLPTARFEWGTARSIARFGGWVMVASFQTWLFLSADNAIAGYLLGARGLGLYSVGFNFANLLPGMVGSALSAVAYPTFCALQNSVSEIGKGLVKLQSLISLILFPAAFGLSAIAGPVIGIVYGTKWAGIEIVIGYLAIMPGISNLWSLNADAYRAVGRPSIWPKLAGLNLIILIPLLFIAGRFGLLAFTVARFAGAFILPILSFSISSSVLSISFRRQLSAFTIPLICSAAMFILIHLLLGLMGPFEQLADLARIFAIVVVSGFAYICLLLLLKRDSWHQLRHAAQAVFKA